MMCDRCLRVLGEDEPMFGFVLVDDEDNQRAFRGHEQCVQQMAEVIQQLYGKKEEENGTSE